MPYLPSLSDTVRAQPGPWYIFGADGPGHPIVVLAGPFLSVTEAERFVPPAASLLILLAADAFPVDRFAVGILTEDPPLSPLLNAFLGLQDNGAPLSSEAFVTWLQTLKSLTPDALFGGIL